ncbi:MULTISPECIES: hypothetical protein [Brevibacterium]|uniref:hypothetical protein n=1 Tax=Brevibacterium TaxID=1696 RepID=UPI001056DF8E|nr:MULTISPECIES: hypothetical protein [Brevibacterium]
MVIDLARDLIHIDTVGRNEDAAISWLIAPLREAGFEITKVPWQERRSNVVARWRSGGQTALCAHVDTVPYETYIGGEEPGLAGGRAKGKKALVAVAVE